MCFDEPSQAIVTLPAHVQYVLVHGDHGLITIRFESALATSLPVWLQLTPHAAIV